jgi:WD40 repeat protein
MCDCPLTIDSGVSCPWTECVPAAESGFLKSLQFSPDGLCTLSATENNNAIICSIDDTEMRSLSYYGNGGDSITSTESHRSRIDAEIPIGEAIYDLKWYPGMQSSNPASKCFISTSRDHPIVLWDAGSDIEKASVRCTYRGYDLADELDSAISLTFNLTGDKIYAGYERMIRLFR